MIELGDKVKIIDIEKVKKDDQLDSKALEIIKASEFKGDVTKIENGIHFVGFYNEIGWVTQGFKPQEIEVIK